MHKTSPLKKNSFTVWLHFRVLTALLATAVDAILPIVLSAMSDRHRALLSSLGSSLGHKLDILFDANGKAMHNQRLGSQPWNILGSQTRPDQARVIIILGRVLPRLWRFYYLGI
jgi:hypothetical protein